MNLTQIIADSKLYYREYYEFWTDDCPDIIPQDSLDKYQFAHDYLKKIHAALCQKEVILKAILNDNAMIILGSQVAECDNGNYYRYVTDFAMFYAYQMAHYQFYFAHIPSEEKPFCLSEDICDLLQKKKREFYDVTCYAEAGENIVRDFYLKYIKRHRRAFDSNDISEEVASGELIYYIKRKVRYNYHDPGAAGAALDFLIKCNDSLKNILEQKIERHGEDVTISHAVFELDYTRYCRSSEGQSMAQMVQHKVEQLCKYGGKSLEEASGQILLEYEKRISECTVGKVLEKCYGDWNEACKKLVKNPITHDDWKEFYSYQTAIDMMLQIQKDETVPTTSLQPAQNEFAKYIIDKNHTAEVLKKLHTYFRGKKGKDLALWVECAIDAGLISKPTFSSLKEEFQIEGSATAFNKYLQKNLFTEAEKAPIIAQMSGD